MCISNRIQIWHKDVISHIFKENQESSPYIYASDMCNNFERKQVLRDAHDKRIITSKIGETYAKSAKTQYGLANRTIWFCQAKPIKLEPPFFSDSTY
jgi:hypothetical protein